MWDEVVPGHPVRTGRKNPVKICGRPWGRTSQGAMKPTPHRVLGGRRVEKELLRPSA